jgi:hypothetical protein
VLPAATDSWKIHELLSKSSITGIVIGVLEGVVGVWWGGVCEEKDDEGEGGWDEGEEEERKEKECSMIDSGGVFGIAGRGGKGEMDTGLVGGMEGMLFLILNAS